MSRPVGSLLLAATWAGFAALALTGALSPGRAIPVFILYALMTAATLRAARRAG